MKLLNWAAMAVTIAFICGATAKSEMLPSLPQKLTVQHSQVVCQLGDQIESASLKLSADSKTSLSLTNHFKLQLCPLSQRSISHPTPLASPITIGTSPIKGVDSSSFAFVSSPKSIAVIKDQRVTLWNWQGQRLHTLTPDLSRPENNIAFSPDGQTIVAWSYTGLLIWNSAGKLLNTVSGDFARAVFSPDSQTLATVENPKTTISLRSATGQLLKKLCTGDTDDSESIFYVLAFSPDGKTVAAINIDAPHIRQWRTNGTLLQDLQPPQGTEVKGDSISPDGELIVWSTSSTVYWWQFQTAKLHQLDQSGNDPGFYLSPNGQQIAIQNRDSGNLEIWHLKTAQLQHRFKLDDNLELLFSPNGQRILTINRDQSSREMKLRDLDGRVLQTLAANQAILAAQFSSDGKGIVTIEADGTIRLWPVNGTHPFLIQPDN